MVQAVFFDLYETLITEWKNNKRIATHSVEKLDVDEKVFKKAWSARRDRRMDGTFPDHQSVVKDILISLGKPINESAIDSVRQQRVNAKLIPFQEIDKEIISMLKTLRQAKIKLGLISNCTAEEVIGWEESLLADLFDDVIFSYKVKKAKPHADIYLQACNHLNVPPEKSLFIGDGGSNELDGASKVGMKAYHATWFQPSYISERVSGFPKLGKPMQVINIIEK